MIAVSTSPEVIEGEWPFSGDVAIERFASKADFIRYRNSDDYAKAKRLIGDSATTHFAIVLDGVE